ncbi:hypothetical protein NHX12_000760, partial [Muraenolepis orangiensis]
MAATNSRSCLLYLIHLAQDNLDFRLPEIKSLLSLRGRPFRPCENYKERTPFWVLGELSEEDVHGVMSRSVCAKSAFELWGHGKTHGELRTSLLKYPLEDMSPYMQKDSTYKINALEYLPFKGNVNLKNPQHTFTLLEDYGTDPNNIPDQPLCVYFGRWIADGQRELIRSYSVKNRHFIGNTSMDAGLAFIMANHAAVKENDLVFDPFVGTGSLLVACSHFGAYVCGTDIDYNTIHGKGRSSRKNHAWRGPDENIRANLRQYGKEKAFLDVMVSDASKPTWRPGLHFDAIITDPPYGIRRHQTSRGLLRREPHLLTFSARHLVPGGRLVYWLPVHSPEMISNSEQTLSSNTSRRLITMQKFKEPEESDALADMSEPCYSPFHGHNAFREKYFSGVYLLTHRCRLTDRFLLTD